MPKLIEHTDEQIQKGLAVLAGCAEDYNLADELLKEQGINGVGADLLRKWRKTHAEDYNTIRKEIGPALEQVIIQDFKHRAARAAQVALLAIEKAETRLRSNQDSNPAKTAESLAKVADINLSKALTLEGRPSEIKETRNPLDSLNELVRLGVLQLPAGES